jgi:AcrR family transcriptional regulator
VARPVKSKQIPNLQAAIKEVAWKQIAETGASQLSLRAVARELKISAPAIYNYFKDRDALVTALMIEAFRSLGDCTLEAMRRFPGPERFVERFREIGMAYREWALTNPQRYLLIFGNPVPGYVFQGEVMRHDLQESIAPLTILLGELYARGMLKIPEDPAFGPGGSPVPQSIEVVTRLPEAAISSITILIWSRVHGLVSLELAGHHIPSRAYASALYRYELESIAREFINI